MALPNRLSSQRSRLLGLVVICLTALAGFGTPSEISAQSNRKLAPAQSQRSAILNALRPRAQQDLGGPVEFVVGTLNQNGEVAFVQVVPQKPGGQAFDLAQTPVGRDGAAAEMDGADITALMYRRNGRWTVEHYGIGATDVWWAGTDYCARYGRVFPRQAAKFVCNMK
jgi:hypothetical protein